ncbi:MAG TPA: hypothetical protein VHX17_03215 [Candidatus Cybelea sp.]|nr:hypothetical protein [Candidatus Cybelea sp.]
MPLDDLVLKWNKRLIRALAALDGRLAANTGDPLVVAGRRVPRSAVFAIFPPQRKNVGTTREEAAKERNLLARAKLPSSLRAWSVCWASFRAVLNDRRKLGLDREPPRVESTQLSP